MICPYTKAEGKNWKWNGESKRKPKHVALVFFPRLLLINMYEVFFRLIFKCDTSRGPVVRVSDYWSWGPGFDYWFCHGDFSLKGKIPMVTMVWIVQ
jgi:hypothetical protein